jgi:CheY-like chemotaxis protein
MPLRAVILGKVLIVRQPIAQSLSALDFEVFESADFADAFEHLDFTRPSVVVMDADGTAREWRALAARLGAGPGAAALVLVTSRFSFDDAHDALALRVAGVIVKPFRKEEHAPRLLDLALRKMNVRARRAAPRFAVPASMNAVLRVPRSDGEDVLPVRNIAEGGAMIDTEAVASAPPFAAGGFVPLATLAWGDVQVEAQLDVVHWQENSAGVRFARIFEGGPKLLRALKDRHEKALGPQGGRRKW